MSFVRWPMCFSFVMNTLSWPWQSYLALYVAAGGSCLGHMSDDLGNHRPMSLFVALWMYMDCTWPQESRTLGHTDLKFVWKADIFIYYFSHKTIWKKFYDLKWLKIIMHDIRLLLLFFKDSRALLELIFYVSKYKYTLHFDFFSVWLQWEMSKILLCFPHFIHLCFIFIYNFYGNNLLK